VPATELLTSSTENELILSLEAMNAVESVDVGGRTMRVEAGVTLQQSWQSVRLRVQI
jgi:FAD/FMN-containing dehydrogenase